MTQQDVTRNRPSSVHYAKAVVHGIALFAAETPFAGRWAPRPLDLTSPLPAAPPSGRCAVGTATRDWSFRSLRVSP